MSTPVQPPPWEHDLKRLTAIRTRIRAFRTIQDRLATAEPDTRTARRLQRLLAAAAADIHQNATQLSDDARQLSPSTDYAVLVTSIQRLPDPDGNRDLALWRDLYRSLANPLQRLEAYASQPELLDALRRRAHLAKANRTLRDDLDHYEQQSWGQFTAAARALDSTGQPSNLNAALGSLGHIASATYTPLALIASTAFNVSRATASTAIPMLLRRGLTIPTAAPPTPAPQPHQPSKAIRANRLAPAPEPAAPVPEPAAAPAANPARPLATACARLHAAIAAMPPGAHDLFGGHHAAPDWNAARRNRWFTTAAARRRQQPPDLPEYIADNGPPPRLRDFCTSIVCHAEGLAPESGQKPSEPARRRLAQLDGDPALLLHTTAAAIEHSSDLEQLRSLMFRTARIATGIVAHHRSLAAGKQPIPDELDAVAAHASCWSPLASEDLLGNPRRRSDAAALRSLLTRSWAALPAAAREELARQPIQTLSHHDRLAPDAIAPSFSDPPTTNPDGSRHLPFRPPTEDTDHPPNCPHLDDPSELRWALHLTAATHQAMHAAATAAKIPGFQQAAMLQRTEKTSIGDLRHGTPESTPTPPPPRTLAPAGLEH